MKKVIMLLAIAVTFPGLAAAQGPVEMIAYDSCYFDYWFTWETWCDTGVAAVDGSKSAGLGDGIEPVWSPDGTKIAYAGYRQPGIFVLNLSDWSAISLSSGGASPAWSPNGSKLAFSAGELYVMNAGGSGTVQLTNNVGFRGKPAWSPDGGTIAFDCEVVPGNLDICATGADGTNFRRLTFDDGGDSGPAFSPDGFSIAFATTLNGWGPQIAIMNLNGTGITPVGAGVFGVDPAWSPDGARIAYVVPYAVCDEYLYCYDVIYLMNRDGTNQIEFGVGSHPHWGLSSGPVALLNWQGCNELNCTFDASGSWSGNGPIVNYSWNFGDGMSLNGSGPTVTHTYANGGTYRVTLTVTNDSGGVATQSWNIAANISPVARFTYACSAWRCTFDASGSSDSDGRILYFSWNLGDGSTAEGPIVTHVYNAASPFTVTLTVTDDRYAWSTQQQVVDLSNLVNAPPVALFTAACTALTCTFDGSGSSDPDGILTSYAWAFGDGTTASGVGASHSYAAGGAYAVSLTVRDNFGATSVQTASVTVIQPAMHIGDVDGVRTNEQNTWTAGVTITVHDGNHSPLANATVTGIWSIGGAASCTTGSSGQCYVNRAAIPRSTQSVVFTIVNVTKPVFLYGSADNHDPDGDSNGTSITVRRP